MTLKASLKVAATLGASLCLTPLPGSAADFSDPTWPCVARKVERLSAGLMWPHPIEEAEENSDLARDASDLADALGLRRVELPDLEGDVRAFAQKYNGDPKALGLVFGQVFDSLSTRRARIIKGIGEFSLGQIALAENIDKARLEMDAQLAREEPDYDRVDKLEEQIDWDQVIHSDRQRSITYLCETPQLLEKRLFAIAQMLMMVVEDD